MKIFSWNIRRAGSKHFKNQLIDLFNTHKSDFTILMELD